MALYDLETARKLVIQAGLKLQQLGLIARTWGNISARISDSQFVITPSGRSYETLTRQLIKHGRRRSLLSTRTRILRRPSVFSAVLSGRSARLRLLPPVFCRMWTTRMISALFSAMKFPVRNTAAMAPSG